MNSSISIQFLATFSQYPLKLKGKTEHPQIELPEYYSAVTFLVVHILKKEFEKDMVIRTKPSTLSFLHIIWVYGGFKGMQTT